MEVRQVAIITLLAAGSMLLLSCSPDSGKVKLPVIKDTVAWMYRGEPDFDFGAVEPLFVEGVHYCALLGFDVSAAQGKKVASARLWLHRSGDEPIIKLLLGTISVDWIEGSGTGRGADRKASCAAYVRLDPATRKPVRWAGPGSDITDVIFSHGNTLKAEGVVSQAKGGWQAVEVPVEIAQALVRGDAFGLVLMDAKGQQSDPEGHFITKRFNSRDSDTYAPYLEVELEPVPAQAQTPGRPGQLAVYPAPDKAGLASGSLRLVIESRGRNATGGDACCYEAVISPDRLDDDNVESARPLPRKSLPYIGRDAGEDTVLVTGLAPGAVRYLAVRLVNRYGHKGPWVFLEGKASEAIETASFSSPLRPGLGGRLRVWACGAEEKVNPVNGRLLEENPGLYNFEGAGDYDYKYGNHLWNSSTSTVSLDVPRGGTAAFHVVVEPAGRVLEGIKVKAEPVFGAGARITPRLFRDWYIKSEDTGAWYPEVALPLEGPFSIPVEDNQVAGQRNQSVLVEYFVPRAARPGTYRTRVVVGARGLMARTVTVKLTVHKAVLPQRLPFISELNCYGPFSGHFDMETDSDEYFDLEQKYYRMAHDHLSVLNQLTYSQSGEVSPVGAPVVEGQGAQVRVTDWSRWDRRWGRYLDGSAFEGSDRPVPVSLMYLPFHENWPAEIDKYYRFTPTDTSYVGMINEHTLEAPPIDQAFEPDYGEAFVSLLKQFAEHFRAEGWNRTEFHVYLNNKYYWKRKRGGMGGDGSSWWLLDEPYQWDDFLALRYFGRLFERAVGNVRDVKVIYRIDASRPHLQFGLLDGFRSVYYVSTFFYSKNAYLVRRKAAFGDEIRNYGHFNRLEETNLTNAAWPLKVWLGHGSGTLPWQTIGGDRNFESFASTAVLYPGRRFGIMGPVASLRLKAVRRGVEDAVLLEMLAARQGWNREQAAVAVAGVVNLGSRTVSEFFDDAGRVAFEDLSPEDLSALRKAILRSLD